MTTIDQFRHQATIAIADIKLQSALKGATGRFDLGRQTALAAMPDSDALRDQLKQVRSATLSDLATHLERFEERAQAAGAQVHWANDGAEACQLVVDLAQRHGVQLVTKGKSMVTEEIHLNRALENVGVEAVETDLGEWIIQLAQEAPYHIIGPAIHKTRQQVAELLERESGRPQSADDIPALTAEARRMLRQKFLEAGLGISGVNVGVAETGSIVLVMNEGNGRMVSSLPPVHVAIMGIEKLVPTWDEAAVWLSLLARSATGQPLSIYTNIITGPAHEDDPDGPQEVHIILLDNGRSRLLGTDYEEVLQCIRCGACLNVCPVYRQAGGHAYGSPYSGPIGAVITPLLFGLEEYEALPQASSLCGACLDVCPARIDLPRLLLALRQQDVAEGIVSARQRLAERGTAFALGRERLWRLTTSLMRQGQRPWLRSGHLALPANWNPGGRRRTPSLAPRSFRSIWPDLEDEDERP